MTWTLNAVVYKEDDIYVADCPEIGTVSQGSSADEAIANLKEATELFLEQFPLKVAPESLHTTFNLAIG